MDRSKLRRETLDTGQPFAFSQASLQDFDECARRFQLRYLLRLTWPAPQAEPVQEHERHIRRGERFHRLAQQALSGIPLERLDELAQADADPDLATWWDNFTRLLPTLQQGKQRSELMLSAPLGKHRLLAQYDLIQVYPDEKRAVIWDWKTSPNRPKRAWLENRLQTRVYPYLLARAGAGLNGGVAFDPGKIEMIYWFAAFPHQPERFEYGAKQLQRDERSLLGRIRTLEEMQAEQFVKTEDERLCRFCVYRSLCERGAEAGSLAESGIEGDLAAGLDFDFDQVGEIQF